MNRLFFTLALLFCLISPSFGRDFGDKPLDPEAQAKLDTLVEKLSDPSSKKREKTISEILKFGDGAIETLQKAQFHPDFTVSECAKYCLSMMVHGVIRSADSPRVQNLLHSYESSTLAQKLTMLERLSQFPFEESFIPLMRIVMREKNPTAAHFSALAALWTLPYTQPLPQFPLPVPEPKIFPNPEKWSAQNESNRAKRLETLEKLREYLASEATHTEGKRFLERLLQLEKSAQAENPDLAPFEEMFQSLHEKINAETPIDLTVLLDFLYLSADLLVQNGHEKEAKDFFQTKSATGLTSIRKVSFRNSNDRSLTMDYRVFLIRRLVLRGHWTLVPQEIALLNNDVSDLEKERLLDRFTLILLTIGEFNIAREYIQNVRRLVFMKLSSVRSEEQIDEKSVRLNQQIAQCQAMDACMKKDYAKAKEILIKILEAKGEPDVNLLILAWEIASFTKDSEWLAALEKRINEMLDQIEKDLQTGSQIFPNTNQMNTYAWLASNTNRKLDEALKYAEDAVRRIPDSSGIQDTLATVYFARGDYEKAFEIQTKAVTEGDMEMELWPNLERIRVYRDEKKSEKVETTP